LPAHRFTTEEAHPLIYFANERHDIYLRKAFRSGEKVPDWANPKGIKLIIPPTPDPPKTKHIREPFWEDENLWFMLAISRFVNWPPTLERLIESPDGWPLDYRFTPERMTMVLEEWKARGNKVETGAYMIRAESDPKKEWYSWSKQRYVSEIVLGRPWRDREVIRDYFCQKRTLQEVWEGFNGKGPNGDWVGWGPFMAGQIVADLRHTRYLCDAPDVGRWAPLGPGSTRGLNRLAGRPLKQSMKGTLSGR
jgi:hypothetical protein